MTIPSYIFFSLDGAEAMTEPKAMPSLLDLTDELLAASMLLAIMAEPGANKALVAGDVRIFSGALSGAGREAGSDRQTADVRR
jgi:hypothetical protein